MYVQPDSAAPDRFYPLFLQAIIPRPIAWVLSENADGGFNAAPFSFFNGVCAEPPLLMIAVGRKDDGSPKDTWANIEARGDFVVHIPPADMASAMVATSKSLAAGESELAFAGLTTAAVDGERLPRLVGPKVALFCRRHRVLEIGTERASLILGEVTGLWVDDAAVRREGERIEIDPRAVDPVARLGGAHYALLGPLTTVRRP